MTRAIPFLVLLLGLVSSVLAQPETYLKGEAKLNFDAVQPGQQAVAAVVLDIDDGYHAQSAQAEGDYIPLRLTMTDSPSFKAYPAIYPKGVDKNYPDLGKLSVYEGQVVIYVPIRIASDATAGDLSIDGKVKYQVCNDNSCFPPTTLKWSIKTKIVGKDTAVHPVETKVFEGFDPKLWDTIESGASTQPTTAPSSVAPSPGAPAAATTAPPALLGTILTAFAVGILLNVVPCVLPVLPIKAVGFYEAANHSRMRSMMFGLAFSIGIVATFGVIALIVILSNANWGAMFSNPWFAGVVTLLMVVAAFQSFGFLEFVLPNSINRLEASHDTIHGNVIWGGLTALLSTPCTIGPFGGIIAIALASGPVAGSLILMCCGAGMASPYLLLSATPEIARKFPRTGAWPNVVKQMMGFLLLATAVFFVQPVLPAALQGAVAWWTIFAFIAMAGAFLVTRTIQIAPRPRPIAISTAIALVLAAGALALTTYFTRPTVKWQAFSDQALADARRSGKPVVIDFTAAWCVNCHVVESSVFADESTKNELARRGVVTFKADLSDENAPGWKLLAELNSARSIPFTAVYNPGTDQPAKLTGVYSSGDLLQKIQ